MRDALLSAFILSDYFCAHDAQRLMISTLFSVARDARSYDAKRSHRLRGRGEEIIERANDKVKRRR